MNKIIYWIILVIWLGIIFTLSSIPSLEIKDLGTWDFVFRKIAHFAEFFILAALLFLALTKTIKYNKWTIMAVILFGVFYAATDEMHQTFVQGRHGDLADVALDGLGVITGTLIFYYFKFLRTKKQPR